MKTIIFATTNQGKVASLRRALDGVGLNFIDIDARSLDIIEPQADSCEEIAVSKAKQAFNLLHLPVLVDDSSFHIAALGGFPGVYAKYMNETLGATGIIDFMKDKTDRSAHFDGALVYVDESGIQHVFRQVPYRGVIAEGIHSMDDATAWSELHKIFIPTGSDKVLGEMTDDDFKKLASDDTKHEKFAMWLRSREA